jgi:hypothetical protein
LFTFGNNAGGKEFDGRGGGLLYQQKGPPFGDPALGDSPLESTIVEFIYSGLLFSKGDIFREMLQPVFRKAADIHH